MRFSLRACTALVGIALSVALLPDPVNALDFAEYSRFRDVRQARDTPQRGRIPRALQSRSSAGRSVGTRAMLRRATAEPREPLPQGPLVLVVSLEQQQLSVYSQGRLIETTKVSTGTVSDPTPSGIFAVIEKNEKHFSNIYGGAPMPFMQRLTMSGVALHSGHVTGRPASHGCVRLPHDYARRLFRATKLGARVIVSGDNPMPVEIDNLQLLEPERIAAATRMALASPSDITTGSVSETASNSGASPPAPAAVDKSIDPRTGRLKGPLSLQRDEVLRAAPVSILVSRADAKVYVRHMFEAVIEAPIKLAEPNRPLGTHVYTLAEMQADGSGQKWSALTVKLVPRRAAAVRVLAGKRSRAARALDASRHAGLVSEGVASTSVEAVERFSLPPTIIAQIAPLLRPGASIVVTDLPQSRRTQTGWTDVIVSP